MTQWLFTALLFLSQGLTVRDLYLITDCLGAVS